MVGGATDTRIAIMDDKTHELRILKRISYGKDLDVYKLKPDQIVPADFFTEEQQRRLIDIKAVEMVMYAPESESEVPEPELSRVVLADITEMPVARVLELLSSEVKPVNLEKYRDQEQGRKQKARTRILKYIDDRIQELTGYSA
jgi:hypothetical protein